MATLLKQQKITNTLALSYLITPLLNQPSLPLQNRRKKAMFSLFKKIRHLQFPKPSLLCHLFESLIRPIANYGCEVWGHVKAEDLEVVHHKFCKFALRVPNTATNLAVYGELGRVPLEIKRRSAIIKYWL